MLDKLKQYKKEMGNFNFYPAYLGIKGKTLLNKLGLKTTAFT
jgi:hypothetical protein